MNPQAQDEYLVTEVMTASPQKLHLMVVETALRYAVRAKKFIEEGQFATALSANLRSQKAVCTMLAGLNRDGNSQLSSQISGIYLFIYKSLIAGQQQRDPGKLADAIRILEMERETWLQVCSQVGEQTRPAATSPLRGPHMLQDRDGASDTLLSGELSFEA